MAVTQSAAYEDLRTSYGGSDPTLPSFLRPYYVKYNSVSKSKDLGETDILVADLSGTVGSQAGANTLFFKVVLPRNVELSVRKRSSGTSTDHFISVGILDGDRRPIQIDRDGYGFLADVHNTDLNESILGLPAGTYYVTVSSGQWQAVPYAITVFVGRYALLSGAVTGFATPSGQLPLIKVGGPALGTAIPAGTIVGPNRIKNASGAAGGSAIPSLELAILRGVVIGQMLPSARLMMNWKLAGKAGGNASCVATLSSEAPYGGGYGY
ncbi:MAG: hypothetical protein EB075_01625 [Bacteroidetes bacterium]|nr:hypothetical protein [Bacteroidota bacterium]